MRSLIGSYGSYIYVYLILIISDILEGVIVFRLNGINDVAVSDLECINDITLKIPSGSAFIILSGKHDVDSGQQLPFYIGDRL